MVHRAWVQEYGLLVVASDKVALLELQVRVMRQTGRQRTGLISILGSTRHAFSMGRIQSNVP